MNIHETRPLTDGIIASLQAAGITVGDAVAPTNPSSAAGYVVVYGMPGGILDGTLGNPDDDASVIYQLTSVGSSPRQCEWVADKARLAMLAATITLANRTVTRIMVDMLGGTIRDDDAQPPVYYSPDRYRLTTTPQAA